MGTVLRSIATFLAVLAITFAAGAQERRIDELMRKSGIWQHMGQVQEAARLGAEEARRQAKANPRKNDLTEAQHQRMVAAMDKAFSPERLRKAMRDELLKEIAPEDEEEVLRWLSTELGTRITNIEEQRETPEEQAKMEREAPRLLESLPAERRAKYERMASSINAGESSANMLINVTTAIAYGIAIASPHGDVAMVKSMREQMEAQRPQMVAALGQRSIGIFAYTYKALSDEELEKYVQFAESPAGKRYHDATTRALDRVFAKASLDMGRDFGAKPLEIDRRS